MKNLLACYANCRFNTGCDDLRGELADKTEQAERDINDFLRERGQKPIQIKTLARGLKFIPLSTAPKKNDAIVDKSRPAIARLSKKKGARKKTSMPSRTQIIEPSTQKSSSTEQKSTEKKAKRKAASSKVASARSKAVNGKLYIILEGDAATVVDQHGLMQRMMSKPSSSARYFEAHEVEARIQIVAKR